MLRLIQIFVPEETEIDIDLLLEEREILGRWVDNSPEHRQVVHLLVPADETEAVMDRFEQAFSGTPLFHMVLLPVEAVLPRPKAEEPADETPAVETEPAEAPKKYGRVSREELYSEADEGSRITRGVLALTLLSAVVAAIGLHKNDVAVIIGAMVIAPLLGPNVAMALGTTLGDLELLRRALKTSLIQISTGLALAVVVGLAFPISMDNPAISARTEVGPADIILALASGIAGSLAFTLGLSQALIGVMVAVALMPPLVVFGMLLGQAAWIPALHALMLLTINIICINLAAVGTFLSQGVRPLRWWEEAKAKKAARRAILIWSVLLAVLAGLLFWGMRR
jgi:uncharacterized hydrophobic protein (TIGR00341 family)